MKKMLLLIIVFLLSHTLMATAIEEKIYKFAGVHAEELITYYNKMNYEQKYVMFLLNNCSANDLAVLTPSFLKENIQLAMQAYELDYCEYDDQIFKHFVLPYRVSQEPLENWRNTFFELLLPIVENANSIEEAAILVNLWVTEQMTFKQTHGRDQTPLTTIKRGFGRCEESMILYIAAARSVGIPARPASVPFWNFTDNNHAWVEIWTPEGWKYLGEAENSLNKTWFTETTKRATLITAEAFGNFDDINTIKQENSVTYLSSIDSYTNAKDCTIFVRNQNFQPVEDATVFLYAVSYGGLFPMIQLHTNEMGEINIPLGAGTIYVTASKDSTFASVIFSTMNSKKPNLQLTLEKNNTDLHENLTFLFPIPADKNSHQEKEEVLGERFYLLRENAHLKRKERLANYKKTKEFVKFYDTVYWNKIETGNYAEQSEFLEKCDQLATNTEIYLTTYKKNKLAKQKILTDMILEWDVKELVEIPDSISLQMIVDIFYFGKQKNLKVVSDSLFRANVIHRTWKSVIPPENGWQRELYPQIKHLAVNDLSKTVTNTIQWIDERVIVDSQFVFTYFSGSLNPIQMLNMRHIPSFYRTVLLNSILKLLGVPIQWKDRLEYFDGDQFVNVEPIADEKEESIIQKVVVSIKIDGEKVKAEPWSNFLISKLEDNGSIRYCFFEGENDSLDYIASFPRKKDDVIYIESAHRNSNGDANVLIYTISEDETEIKLDLKTPKEYLDNSLEWSEKTIRNVKKLANNDFPSLVVILGSVENEPEKRVIQQLQEKKDDFTISKTHLHYVSLRKENNDIEVEKIIKKNIFTESLESTEFPLLFAFDKNGKLTFSSKGYHMGIAKLILRKLR